MRIGEKHHDALEVGLSPMTGKLMKVACAFAMFGACAAQADPYYITPNEMLEVYGVYPLSNGDVLKVSRDQRRYWAEMRHTGRIEIVPVDSIVFVEKGGKMRFTFEPKAFATDVRIEGIALRDVAFAAAYGRSNHSGIQGKFGE
jgi:hypothetical protein